MSKTIDDNWRTYITTLPHQSLPYSKKNWGNPIHSLCSYQGKLKPAIASHLVKIFVPDGGTVFDPFSGVGTIPFEAALNGRHSFGMDISPLAFTVSEAKVKRHSAELCDAYINNLASYISTNLLSDDYIESNQTFGFNKQLKDYYHEDTFKEILSARQFVSEHFPSNQDEALVVASLLHILHGNRPYALSRRSHPIVPYAPTGDYEYKNLIVKLREKVNRALAVETPSCFIDGSVFLRDSTQEWPDDINNLDAIITSPPFFDSTRFYLANWIRLWFMGWNTEEFKTEPEKYIDERQKVDFSIYESIFAQARERLKDGGYFVMHLGKSKKCDMGEVLKHICGRWFPEAKLYNESVVECEKFGIKDIGTVTSHQYLIMEKRG